MIASIYEHDSEHVYVQALHKLLFFSMINSPLAVSSSVCRSKLTMCIVLALNSRAHLHMLFLCGAPV